jgi:hypothetical protein
LEVKDPISFLLSFGKSSWHIRDRKENFSSTKRCFFSYAEHFWRERGIATVFL